MKPNKSVGIIGYGAYVPKYRIQNTEIARVWGNDPNLVPIEKNQFQVPMRILLL